MNIEILKYNTSEDAKIIYAYLSDVANNTGAVEVKIQQYKLDEVIVPSENVTKTPVSDNAAFVAVDVTDVGGFSKQGLFLINISIGSEQAEYPVYDYNEISVAKLDLINIMVNNDLTDNMFSTYIKLMFLENGIKDTAMYSDIIECNKFYTEFIELVRTIKTKYYYNEKNK